MTVKKPGDHLDPRAMSSETINRDYAVRSLRSPVFSVSVPPGLRCLLGSVCFGSCPCCPCASPGRCGFCCSFFFQSWPAPVPLSPCLCCPCCPCCPRCPC